MLTNIFLQNGCFVNLDNFSDLYQMIFCLFCDLCILTLFSLLTVNVLGGDQISIAYCLL